MTSFLKPIKNTIYNANDFNYQDKNITVKNLSLEIDKITEIDTSQQTQITALENIIINQTPVYLVLTFTDPLMSTSPFGITFYKIGKIVNFLTNDLIPVNILSTGVLTLQIPSEYYPKSTVRVPMMVGNTTYSAEFLIKNNGVIEIRPTYNTNYTASLRTFMGTSGCYITN